MRKRYQPALSDSQFQRAAGLEISHQRLQQLLRMGPAQRAALLSADPGQVAVWIRSAAECGLPAAQLCLGRLLLVGRGLVRDELEAFRCFQRAADQGEAEAMNMVGRCHENGWGVAVDLRSAARCYRASAEAGHDWGQYNCGNLLFDGRGVAADLHQALSWYLRAAQQGHGRAMNLVGRCLEEGWGCVRAPDEALYWYRRSAESGYFRGQFNHALTLVRQGLGSAAAHWFWAAASGGDLAMRAAILAALDGAPYGTLREVRERVRGLAEEAADGGNAQRIAASRPV